MTNSVKTFSQSKISKETLVKEFLHVSEEWFQLLHLRISIRIQQKSFKTRSISGTRRATSCHSWWQRTIYISRRWTYSRLTRWRRRPGSPCRSQSTWPSRYRRARRRPRLCTRPCDSSKSLTGCCKDLKLTHKYKTKKLIKTIGS
jgi:hypothetical protein